MAKRPSSKSKPSASGGGEAVRVAIFHGPESFLRQKHTDDLRRELEEASGGGGGLDIVRFDGLTAPIGDILDECRTFGLMAPHKLVIVDNTDALVKAEDEEEAASAAPVREAPAAKGAKRRPAAPTRRSFLERYAQSPSDNATLVLRSETWRPGKLDKFVEAGGGPVIKCEEVKPAAAESFAVAHARDAYARTLAPDAAKLLVERLGTGLGRIDTELAKLATAAPAGKPIDAALIADLVESTREDEKAWVIQDDLLTGDPQRVLSRLYDMLVVSRLSAVPIRWAYADLARKLHAASRGLRAGKSPWELASELRLWGGKDQILAVAKRENPDKLAGLLQAAIDADFAGKTGHGDDRLGLEVLSLRFVDVCA